MVSKRVIVGFVAGAITTACLSFFFFTTEKETTSVKVDMQKQVKNTESTQNIQTTVKNVEKKHDLYSSSLYDLPLVSIYEISKLSDELKKIIDNELEVSQGFYYLKRIDDKIFIILQNPVMDNIGYSRHDLQFVEIYDNGTVIRHNAGYVGVKDEIESSVNIKKKEKETWLLDESIEPFRPIKHVAYDEHGKIKFTEYWSYDENEPVKYKMLDSNKNLISILKETQDSDSNLRKEHVFYDSEGNTTMSLTVNYDGANISRMMFYNSHDLVDSVNILSEYVDGYKIKESIYNEKYDLINIFVSAYENGIRKTIRVFDSEGNEVDKISS